MNRIKSLAWMAWLIVASWTHEDQHEQQRVRFATVRHPLFDDAPYRRCYSVTEAT